MADVEACAAHVGAIDGGRCACRKWLRDALGKERVYKLRFIS